jgi:hypothetical protein
MKWIHRAQDIPVEGFCGQKSFGFYNIFLHSLVARRLLASHGLGSMELV